MISSPKKKKKEEVQVYYVKYKHDQHHGLQVDVPVPAIAPKIHDDSSHEEAAQADEPVIVTLPPPRKATTIRAIIHPESEKFQTHGNVRVSFGSPPPLHRQENARQISEYNNEESALQPVVAHPNSPNSVSVDDAAYSKHDQYFDIQGRVVNNFNHVNHVQPPQKPSVNFNVNQVLPPQKPPVNFHPQQQQQGQFQHIQFSQGPARPQFVQQQQFNQPPQTHQQFHFHQNQQQQQRPQSSFQHQQPSQQQFFSNGQRGQFPPHQLQLPTKQAVRFNNQQAAKFQFGQQQQQHKQQTFQTHQPRPIPIPLHQVQQQQQNNNQQQSFSNVRFNQPFTAFQSQPSQPPEIRRPETTRPTEPRPIVPTRSNEVSHFHTEQFVQQNNEQNQQQQHQQPPRSSQPQTTSVHQGLVQQQAPQNLAQQNPQLREHLQHLKYVLPAGGEVVASIPQYEQHITETIQNPPRSQQQHAQQVQQAQQSQFHQQQHAQQVQQNQQSQFHHHQQPQAQHSHRQEVTPPPLIHKQVTSNSNIGPLAHSIGHLSVGERQQFQQTTSRPVVQEFQRLPSHSQQQQPSFNGPQQFPSENVNFHHQFESRPNQHQQNHLQQASHQQFKVSLITQSKKKNLNC